MREVRRIIFIYGKLNLKTINLLYRVIIMKIIQLFAFLAIMLFSLNAIAQEYRTTADGRFRTCTIYKPKYSKGNHDIITLKDEIANLLKQCEFLSDWNAYGKKSTDIKVFDDRIEITNYKRKNVVLTTNFINFADLQSQPIYLTQSEYSTGGLCMYPYHLVIESKVELSFHEPYLEQAKKLTFYFICLQYLLNEENTSKHLAEFELIAAGYRALKEKPVVSEEQRKFFIQANAFTEKKEYDKAIELTIKAIRINNLAFPVAYSNLALLYAQYDYYQTAILYMKKYIMLEPEAAREAQDKIYEWEANIIE